MTLNLPVFGSISLALSRFKRAIKSSFSSTRSFNLLMISFVSDVVGSTDEEEEDDGSGGDDDDDDDD
eukprot:CAMPEP_0195261306 /NCGR_PEP_ID=MMETSP0706-20130129/9069_1 /TAXON_ID=33640 /ORGANISM="Asterionellopsis glacialis, Strain CCMP134" /LENGTH=66 /DNA_ID=CAMNT_0040315147 /DNA_START=215 /DNA_END=412 /DNA_ORIENTATION=-